MLAEIEGFPENRTGRMSQDGKRQNLLGPGPTRAFVLTLRAPFAENRFQLRR
jgi:hypothetical protein